MTKKLFFLRLIPGIVDCAEGPVADLPEVVEQLLRVLALEQLRHVRVLQAARPGTKRTFFTGKFIEHVRDCLNHRPWLVPPLLLPQFA
jgi:hypothetical protein